MNPIRVKFISLMNLLALLFTMNAYVVDIKVNAGNVPLLNIGPSIPVNVYEMYSKGSLPLKVYFCFDS